MTITLATLRSVVAHGESPPLEFKEHVQCDEARPASGDVAA